MQTDIVIIGAGPVGLFTVFQAGMLGMRSHVFDSLELIGGQCSALYPEKPIYDIPAYPKVTGQGLIDKLQEQAGAFHPVYHLGQQVVDIQQYNNNFIVTGSKGSKVEAKIVVIAAGPGAFGPNKPPLNEIEDFEGKSVFYNVNNIDGFAGKKIAIAGGGDSAVDWAIALSGVASKLYVIHRRDKFRALPETVKQMRHLADQGKIELVIGYQLEALHGKDGNLDQVIVSDLDKNLKTLDANILLPFFGLAQELGPIENFGLEIDNRAIVVQSPYYRTNIEGIYAIGDIATYPGKLKLILTGFAEAASAMHDAYKKVFDGKALHFEYSTTKGIRA